MLVPEPRWLTLPEFDPIDDASDERLELLDGEILAFTGESSAHSQLAGRFVVALDAAVEPRCFVYPPWSLAVRSETFDAVLYPDVSVVCGVVPLDARWIASPILVVEVLGRSTSDRDRGPKLDVYKHLPSLLEVVLVDSRRRWVQHHVRTSDGAWRDRTSAGGVLDMKAVPCTLDIDAVYDRVGVPRNPE